LFLFAGNVLTASTHIITVVVGAGVLALAWAMAQLGWIAGIGCIVTFSAISIFTYSLVADCYRYPDPVTGQRNYTYMQAVKAYLGNFWKKLTQNLKINPIFYIPLFLYDCD